MKLIRDLKNLTKALSPFFRGNYVYGWSFVAALVGVKVILALTKPHTFTPGSTISSAEMNANFDTIYNEVANDRVGFKATMAAGNVTLASLANTAITSSTIVHDPYNSFNTTTGVFTPPQEGQYKISAFFTSNDGINGAIRVFINNDSSLTVQISSTGYNATANAHKAYYQVNSTNVYLQTTDNLHFQLYNTNGGASINIVNPGTPSSFISVYKVNP